MKNKVDPLGNNYFASFFSAVEHQPEDGVDDVVHDTVKIPTYRNRILNFTFLKSGWQTACTCPFKFILMS